MNDRGQGASKMLAPEPLIRCREIQNDLVECVVIEPGPEAPAVGR